MSHRGWHQGVPELSVGSDTSAMPCWYQEPSGSLSFPPDIFQQQSHEPVSRCRWNCFRGGWWGVLGTLPSPGGSTPFHRAWTG